MVGTAFTPKAFVVLGKRSMSTLMKFSCPERFLAAFSKAGAKRRQGAHHDAVKSIMVVLVTLAVGRRTLSFFGTLTFAQAKAAMRTMPNSVVANRFIILCGLLSCEPPTLRF